MAEEPQDNNPAPKKRVSRRARKKSVVTEARRQREFTYRGRSVEDLKALSQEEVMPLLPSSARRYFRRGMDDEARKFLEKVTAADDGAVVRTHVREFPILPVFIGKTISVYNGKEFQDVTVVPEMVGHKLGEFALTRGSVSHTGPGVGATRSSKFMPLK